MLKWTTASWILLLALTGPVAAQYYVRPPTNPYFRPQLSPYFTYYYGPGGLGGAYVVPPALALGGLRAVNPGAAATLGALAPTGLGAAGAGDGQADAAVSGDVTGHPTRFMAYSQFFLTQGGGTGGVTSGTTAPAAGLPAQPFGAAIFWTGSFQRPAQPGTRPPRGRENTRPGGR